AIDVVPQLQTELQALPQDFDLLRRAGGCVGGVKLCLLLGKPILVVTVLQNGFEHVLATFHFSSRRCRYVRPAFRLFSWRAGANTRSNKHAKALAEQNCMRRLVTLRRMRGGSDEPFLGDCCYATIFHTRGAASRFSRQKLSPMTAFFPPQGNPW